MTRNKRNKDKIKPSDNYRILPVWKLVQIGEELMIQDESWRWNDYCYDNGKNPVKYKKVVMDRIKRNKRATKE